MSCLAPSHGSSLTEKILLRCGRVTHCRLPLTLDWALKKLGSVKLKLAKASLALAVDGVAPCSTSHDQCFIISCCSLQRPRWDFYIEGYPLPTPASKRDAAEHQSHTNRWVKQTHRYHGIIIVLAEGVLLLALLCQQDERWVPLVVRIKIARVKVVLLATLCVTYASLQHHALAQEDTCMQPREGARSAPRSHTHTHIHTHTFTYTEKPARSMLPATPRGRKHTSQRKFSHSLPSPLLPSLSHLERRHKGGLVLVDLIPINTCEPRVCLHLRRPPVPEPLLRIANLWTTFAVWTHPSHYFPRAHSHPYMQAASGETDQRPATSAWQPSCHHVFCPGGTIADSAVAASNRCRTHPHAATRAAQAGTDAQAYQQLFDEVFGFVREVDAVVEILPRNGSRKNPLKHLRVDAQLDFSHGVWL